MSACVRYSNSVCTQSAHFHVSGLDNHRKVSAVLRGATQSLGGDLSNYDMRLPNGSGLVLDYGGNIGIFAVAAYLANAGTTTGSCVRVLALEPVPESYLMLRWNLLANNVPLLRHGGCGVRALNLAASQDGRNKTMLLGWRSMNAVVAGGSFLPEAGSTIRRYAVGSTTLEALLQHSSVRVTTSRPDEPAGVVNLLKLDCEGCESEVYAELQGSPALVQRVRAVTGELHGCGRSRTPSTTLLCGQMHQFFRARWNRSHNSLARTF